MQTQKPLLEIKNLHCSVKIDDGESRPILKGINLVVYPGEVHAIMGPNGSGKSTLAQVIAGNPSFVVTEGSILFCGESILELPPEERARIGVFIGFQSPPSIPGVSNEYFLRTSVNAIRRAKSLPALDPSEFAPILEQKRKQLGIDESFLSRGVNEGFSGGEKKRNEILQMTLLEPKLCLLDEIDSGVDIDALRVVTEGINALKGSERSIVMITHWQRLLSQVVPDKVHVLWEGRIVLTGEKELAQELEEKGYEWVKEKAVAEGVVKI
ncbi:Fe-S cluster assembly protein SufC [Monocercomonoides exilis]|uniref:Fe-S cluster assembly protein SufC n=1 Tax=Monocercomonoides exilis TaxID=2049356 RepID=UPI0035599E4C|nr:Fe-S cluster assembly protein SufC [Monocercomonoides exilis]|eukprot:MONOS_1226.1-p1 / transcript=MONOS_1226.1 / gene=MONOS_1226 / organism=Monocercomonoides_exilis_PA203 / gene_product=Fe-S cluster assembly protein SufC / transcript_product=Fe-S cluster assembly protein SufC / location=Mono_scaffold00021:32017-32948(+) / protein_length=268 / sequence_SO=supercontig / SO=protein_coding / is_pseudo=false